MLSSLTSRVSQTVSKSLTVSLNNLLALLMLSQSKVCQRLIIGEKELSGCETAGLLHSVEIITHFAIIKSMHTIIKQKLKLHFQHD